MISRFSFAVVLPIAMALLLGGESYAQPTWNQLETVAPNLPCACDVCRLELDHTPIKKTFFKVEQKTVCIPAVRFPWNKDCPPSISRTRKVRVLKTDSYECPNCSYKWTAVKPEFATAEQTVQPRAATIPKRVTQPSITRKQPPIVHQTKTVAR